MKDRLLELKNSQAAVRVQSGLDRASTSNGNVAPKKTSKAVKNEQQKMDELFKEVQKVRIWIEEIEEDTKVVKRLRAAMLNSPRTDQVTKDKVEETMRNITATSVKAKNGLKSLEKQLNGKMSHLMKRMVAIQHSTLSKRYQNAMSEYQKTLVSHKEKCETHIKTLLRIVIQKVTQRSVASVPVGTQVGTYEELETLLDREDTQFFVDNYMKETQEARQALLDAKSRHKELQRLEKSIMELNELFIDVSILVESQSEMVNQIEYNVEHGVNFVTDGAKETEKANEYRQKSRKKKYLLIMCLITIIAIIVLLIVIRIWLSNLF